MKKVIENEKEFKNDTEYFADKEFVSNSMLRDFNNCEYFFQVKHIDQTFKDEKEYDYFTYGNAVDTILTEKEGMFEEQFAVVDRKVNVNKLNECQQEVEAVNSEIKEKIALGRSYKTLQNKAEKIIETIDKIESVGNKLQLTNAVNENIQASVEELRRQPLYNMFGVGVKGSQEIIALTIDGIKRKGKLDHLDIENKIIADVKTTANIENFDPKIYVNQLAYYVDLVSAQYGIKAEDYDCYLLVVDKANDFKRSNIYQFSKFAIKVAMADNKERLEEYRKKLESKFYTPAPEKSPENRMTKCFKCQNYKNCQYSLQKDITLID